MLEEGDSQKLTSFLCTRIHYITIFEKHMMKFVFVCSTFVDCPDSSSSSSSSVSTSSSISRPRAVLADYVFCEDSCYSEGELVDYVERDVQAACKYASIIFVSIYLVTTTAFRVPFYAAKFIISRWFASPAFNSIYQQRHHFCCLHVILEVRPK